MFNNLKLSTKLIISVAIPVFLLIVIAIAINIVTNNINIDIKRAETISKENFEYALRAKNMEFKIIQIQKYLTDMFATEDMTGSDDVLKPAENCKLIFLEDLEKFKEYYKGRKESEDLIILMESVETSFNDYYSTGIDMVDTYFSEGSDKAKILMQDFNNNSVELRKNLDPFVSKHQRQSNAAMGSIVNVIKQLRVIVITLAILAIILCILISWVILSSVSKIITTTINDLLSSSTQIGKASSELSASSQGIVKSAGKQTGSLEMTSSTLEEISAIAKQNNENAENANQFINNTKDLVDVSQNKMEEMSSAMNNIAESGEEIGKIIKTIDEIAFQTNLLALNAAVEAARAGEAGAGFAVVADEVRNLAQRSADSAKNTQALIETILQKINNGKEVVNDSKESFIQVVNATNKAVNLVNEITMSSKDQNRGVEDIRKSIFELEKISQSNASASEQTASAAEELTAQANSLLGIVSSLKIIVHGGDEVVPNKNQENMISKAKKLFTRKNKPIQSEERTDNEKTESDKPENNINKKKTVNPSEILPLNKEEEETEEEQEKENGFVDFK